MQRKEIAMVVNTHEGSLSAQDSYEIRRAALTYGIPYFTTMTAAAAAAEGIREIRANHMDVMALQDLLTSPR
jgi:carbamoyl-phosphate synthase large subunit